MWQQDSPHGTFPLETGSEASTAVRSGEKVWEVREDRKRKKGEPGPKKTVWGTRIMSKEKVFLLVQGVYSVREKQNPCTHTQKSFSRSNREAVTVSGQFEEPPFTAKRLGSDHTLTTSSENSCLLTNLGKSPSVASFSTFIRFSNILD